MFVFLLLSLANSSKESCQEALISRLSTLLSIDQGLSNNPGFQNLYYSGRDINDLGHYSSCVSQPNSRYILLTYSVTKLGMCVPSDCDSESIQEFLNKYDLSEVTVEDSFDFEFSSGTVIVLILLFLLTLTVLIGTAMDLSSEASPEVKDDSLIPKRQERAWVSYIKCFSFMNSWKCLTAPPFQDNSVVFNGPRFMSMCWVLLGHTFLIWILTIKNLDDAPYLVQNYVSVIGILGFNAVDTFFWFGGFLVAYINLSDLYRRKRLPWGLLIVLRFLRIIPAYAVALATSYCVLLHFVSGPRRQDIEFIREIDCADYWWTNFLFINNFVPDGKGNFCFLHGWYLACDMQLFSFSLIFIYMYYKYHKVIVWLASVGYLIVEFGIRYKLAEDGGYQIFDVAAVDNPEELFQYLYSKPYCRYSAYLFGVLCGFVYSQYKSKRNDDPIANFIIKYTKKFNWFCLVLGWASFQVMVTIKYICSKDVDNNYKGYSDSANVFMVATRHMHIGLSYSLIFLPMLFGRMGIVTDFLGWSGWSSVSKLTYSIYLIHFAILICLYGNDDNVMTWTSTTVVSQAIFYIIIASIGGFLLYILVECPTGELMKRQFKKRKAKVQSK